MHVLGRAISIAVYDMTFNTSTDECIFLMTKQSLLSRHDACYNESKTIVVKAVDTCPCQGTKHSSCVWSVIAIQIECVVQYA